MATIGKLIVRLRLDDRVSPVLRRMQFGIWLYQHPALVMGSITILLALLALTTGILVGERL